jgi:hypothetical protein
MSSNQRWKLALLTLLGGCLPATVNFAQVNPPPMPAAPRAAAQVAVLTSGPPERKHVDVGVVEVEGNAMGVGAFEDLVTMAREEAGRRGCDALVLNPAAFTGEDGRRRVVSGTCVVFSPDPTADHNGH